MRTNTPAAIHLKDYTLPSYLVKEIALDFQLQEEITHVQTRMQVESNPAAQAGQAKPLPLVLNGERIKLISIKIDGEPLDPSQYSVDELTLTIHQPSQRFTLEIENETYPQKNTFLDGLYMSGNIFCTQNEPEGFRKITYFTDRPDVMAIYTTTLTADKTRYPVLLSNGNEVSHGDLAGGKHFVKWHDPFPKPCYLFALVAGDLGCITETFVTKSKRPIDLRIYCDKGNESRCVHSMQSLIKSMKWDEEVFNLECDLDTYMIVAVDAFNMGAMENKGLNIFNTSCALADIETATDENFLRVETVIAHEYFHNWTGNRVTCRDWFQLTLKEGLTVFRDQEFSADMHSRPVQRIDNVLSLRARQFPEDAGPTAHPIQPKSYIQINNFYTPTIYNKGAEVIRMIQTLIGKAAFVKGIAKYFELYDGQAVTTEDFVHAMEIASGCDLKQFRQWYNQAGTPEVAISYEYHPQQKAFHLTVEQSCPSTPDQADQINADAQPIKKTPLHFPLSLGLLTREGKDIPLSLPGHKTQSHNASSSSSHGIVLNITKEKETFVFQNISESPTPSINRHFSAPVRIKAPYKLNDYLFLLAHDSDAFNRWEAGQELASQLILNLAADLKRGKAPVLDAGYIQAFGAVLNDCYLDNSIKAKTMTLPSEASLGMRQALVDFLIDFDEIHQARDFVQRELAKAHFEALKALYLALSRPTPYEISAEAMGKRSLKNTCLSYLSQTEGEEGILLCSAQYNAATNMTDSFSALHLLANRDCPQRMQVLQDFYARWKKDTLVMNKWLLVQASSPLPGTLEQVKKLMLDPIFDMAIPNLVRALLGSLTENHIHFHDKSGSGYRFIVDQVIAIDKLNPQLAAGISGAFKKYRQLDPARKALLGNELRRILALPKMSTNVYEIVSKCLS